MKNVSGLQSIDKLVTTPRLLSTTTTDDDFVEGGHEIRSRERQYEKENIVGLSVTITSLEKNSPIFKFCIDGLLFPLRYLNTRQANALQCGKHCDSCDDSGTKHALLLGEEKSAFVWLRGSRQMSIITPSTTTYNNTGYESNTSSTASYP